MVGVLLLMQAAEMCGMGTVWTKLRSDARKQLLIHGKPQAQAIPIVDAQLSKLAGHPSKLARAAGERLVKLTRQVVNTKAFEHIVVGMLNPKSRLRGQFKTPTVVKL